MRSSSDGRDESCVLELSANARRFLDEGYCLIEDTLTATRLDDLRRGMSSLMKGKLARTRIRPLGPPPDGENSSHASAGRGGNHAYNRWNARLPSAAPFLTNDVVANPGVLSVLEEARRYLGESRQWALTLIGSDVNMPNSADQRPHRDAFLFDVTVNCPLVDVEDDMGPTEVWPGTHRRNGAPFSAGPPSTAIGRVAHFAEWDELRKGPSRSLCIRAGTFVIRDQRMLHRGTANRTNAVRPMLSLYYDLWSEREPSPHPLAMRMAGSWGRLVRRTGHRFSLDDARRFQLLTTGAGVCMALSKLAGTDREGRYRIPSAVWAALNDDARRVLRLADVDGRAQQVSSFRRSMQVLSSAGKNLPRLARQLITPSSRP